MIFFAAVEGYSNIVCFKNMAKYIINEKCHSVKKANEENEVFYWNILFFTGMITDTHAWSCGDYNNLTINGFLCILLLYAWLKVN